MNTMNREHYRAVLLKLRDELTDLEQTGADAAKTVELDQSRVGRLSRMDALQAQAMSEASNRRRAIQLQGIDAALRRLDNDEFGDCRDCDEPIDPKRLEFDPTVRLCIRCASISES